MVRSTGGEGGTDLATGNGCSAYFYFQVRRVRRVGSSNWVGKTFFFLLLFSPQSNGVVQQFTRLITGSRLKIAFTIKYEEKIDNKIQTANSARGIPFLIILISSRSLCKRRKRCYRNLLTILLGPLTSIQSLRAAHDSFFALQSSAVMI